MTSQSSDQEISAALEDLDQVRREQVSRAAAAAPPPEYVRAIVSSEIMINIAPNVLPYSHIDFEQFLDDLRARYGLALRRSPQLDAVIRQQLGRDPDDLSQAALARFTLGATEGLTFEDGRFPTGGAGGSFIDIQSVRLHEQNLGAKVRGRTEIAELLLKEVFELMWHAAGAPKKWEDEEVKRAVSAKGYSTLTKVDLGKNILHLLSVPLINFFETNLTENLRLAPRMYSRAAADNFERPNAVHGVVGLDDLTLVFPTMDLTTGRAERPTLRFSLTAMTDLGTGRVDIYSEMAFDDHVELINGVAHALNSASEQ